MSLLRPIVRAEKALSLVAFDMGMVRYSCRSLRILESSDSFGFRIVYSVKNTYSPEPTARARARLRGAFLVFSRIMYGRLESVIKTCPWPTSFRGFKIFCDYSASFNLSYALTFYPDIFLVLPDRVRRQ